jgi:hypothetical protein
VGSLLIRSLIVVRVLECEYHKLSSPTPLSLPLRRRALSATTTTTTTITYDPNHYRAPAVHASLAKRTPHVPLLPAQPNLRIIPSPGRDGRAAGTTILSPPPLDSARTRAMSASYPKLIHRSKWPAPRGEEMNGSVTTCSTRRERDLVPLVS